MTDRDVTDDMVERLRRSLWSTWGNGRQTTDWPTDGQLREALETALEEPAPAVAMGQKIAYGMRQEPTGRWEREHWNRESLR